MDLHTISSVFLGYNQFGKEVYESTRSPLGELVFRLKYRHDESVLSQIVDTAVEFLRTWRIDPEALVPVPPSSTARKVQPVMAVAEGISAATGLALCGQCISKTKSTAPLKDGFDFDEKVTALKNAFLVDRTLTEGKRLLLFDDLFQTGATASSVTRALAAEGAASAVFLLVLTRTRRK